ncbi:haloacid dehalogenase [Intrasporangium oryzae NRRL B-24470]|uniref:Haloacid dehalogenase n=1 Tax=Intrasporangium oryzae NRRL B-24470 TaxID=1386089 RepID=W9GA63_9MICO|nr:cation-transporting P-type ATPase [Intrasporangium oryzae]EWT00764.1 haloacid dehalogenase [Intrasporangium oryzae NRRL B-24470]
MEPDAPVNRPEERVVGLTDAQVSDRLARDGPNVLPASRPPSPLVQLLRQMVHFFAVILWIAAGLAYVAGMPQLAVAIAVVVVLNGVFAFAQEYRAERAGARLADLLPPRARVVRDGQVHEVGGDELVVDDTVLLEAGDRVSADLRLDRAVAVAVDESMLTGESVTTRPESGGVIRAGTFVVEGVGRGTVIATGGRTRLAEIAALTRAARRPPSPLSRQLHHIVTVVAVLAVGTGVVAFGVSLLLGVSPAFGFLFAVGVTVALVPEGLLPTVTLSLARSAQRMASRHALVRRLESVETLGSTTFICTDKTGTLTRNEMNVVEVWTPVGTARITGEGYAPAAECAGDRETIEAVRLAAASAVECVHGRAVERDGGWRARGDPMEAAIHVLAVRVGAGSSADVRIDRAYPFDPALRRSAASAGGWLHVLGAPDSVLRACDGTGEAEAQLERLSATGLRVLAVARRRLLASEQAEALGSDDRATRQDLLEHGLELLGLVALEDPPRAGVADSVATCRRAGISVMMITGDHPGTAAAIAREVGLLTPGAVVVTGADLPPDEDALGELVDVDGTVVARATPEDKLRIAGALQARGHVVAMTGDGVNDGPALRKADIGVAMGASGTDVAREAADVVLLDDRFETIVAAIELGRATWSNVRRFLTYHLTDNVAELTPFLAWSLSAGKIPLALSVLQILALDIGTDLLPALALGAEPASPRVMSEPLRTGPLLDGRVVRRAFLVLGPAESVIEMAAFLGVLVHGGWAFGQVPGAPLLALASGAAFSAVVLGQLANAFACRSASRPVGAWSLRGNRLLLGAVATEVAFLLVILVWPALADLLGGSMPSPLGWALALGAIPAVLAVDALHKAVRARTSGRARGPATPAERHTDVPTALRS